MLSSFANSNRVADNHGMKVAAAQLFIILTLTSLLTACGKSQSGNDANRGQAEPAPSTAETPSAQQVLSVGEYLAAPRYANADMEYGRRLAMPCRACHSFEPDGPHLTGPNLHGFFGRRVGSADGYAYSPAMTSADFIWTPEALDAWLAQPAAFLPGNRMVYAGLPDAGDRDALVAALFGLTGD